MQPSADAFPGGADRVEEPERSTSAPVPPPRSAPEVESPSARTPATAPTPAPTTSPPTVPAAGSSDGPEDPAGVEPESAVDDGGGLIALTEREQHILAFERHWWRHAGAKEQAIRDTFGLSATRYYQLLNGLLDNPAALAAEPLLIGRLRRLRSSRARNRRR